MAMTTGHELAVSTRSLRKSFRTIRGSRVAVHGLDLDVPTGGVHGFLGPNGSGKTTTIRMLLGLLHADGGTMHIFGTPVPRRLPEVVARVGAIVESPKFFPAFSGRHNLRLLADAIGTPRSRVDEVLEETGLVDRGKDRFAGYSLGMKQRLAIAATLLKSPDLLIFDEPTNGLDPAGIREIRQTMRRLADEGRTVLVSSHILSEVEQVADTVSIIGRGRMLAQGSVAGIIGGGQPGGAVEVGVADPESAGHVLRRAGLEVALSSGGLTVSGADDPAMITRVLAEQRIYLNRLVPTKRDLESVFLELTHEDTLGAATAQPAAPAGRTAYPDPGTAGPEEGR
jgi:ABC-2 type transport system ATP-binding protein